MFFPFEECRANGKPTHDLLVLTLDFGEKFSIFIPSFSVGRLAGQIPTLWPLMIEILDALSAKGTFEGHLGQS